MDLHQRLVGGVLHGIYRRVDGDGVLAVIVRRDVHGVDAPVTDREVCEELRAAPLKREYTPGKDQLDDQQERYDGHRRRRRMRDAGCHQCQHVGSVGHQEHRDSQIQCK